MNMTEADKNFVTEILADCKVDWDKLDHFNQEEAAKLSEVLYSIEEQYGYDTTDVFMVLIDRVYDNVKVLLSVVDSDIVGYVKERISEMSHATKTDLGDFIRK